ncbi:MAG: hypothetical protein M5R41_10465 [Bacteroidia bacterium]|nr:hypothetical protein [Bacteroidia bacterium]
MTSHTLVALATFIIRVDVPDDFTPTPEKLRDAAGTAMTRRIVSAIEGAPVGFGLITPTATEISFLDDQLAEMVLSDRGFTHIMPAQEVLPL